MWRGSQSVKRTFRSRFPSWLGIAAISRRYAHACARSGSTLAYMHMYASALGTREHTSSRAECTQALRHAPERATWPPPWQCVDPKVARYHHHYYHYRRQHRRCIDTRTRVRDRFLSQERKLLEKTISSRNYICEGGRLKWAESFRDDDHIIKMDVTYMCIICDKLPYDFSNARNGKQLKIEKKFFK